MRVVPGCVVALFIARSEPASDPVISETLTYSNKLTAANVQVYLGTYQGRKVAVKSVWGWVEEGSEQEERDLKRERMAEVEVGVTMGVTICMTRPSYIL